MLDCTSLRKDEVVNKRISHLAAIRVADASCAVDHGVKNF
jgi:hypothetical protein